MKAILLSIQPQHVVNILNGEKTLELRKSVPKDFEGWVYIYCTKGKAKEWLAKFYETYGMTKGYTYEEMIFDNSIPLNGKVVAKFWFDEYGEIGEYDQLAYTVRIDNGIITKYGYPKELKEKMCLNDIEIDNYLYTSKNGFLYGWHIKQLTIFDKLLDLNDFELYKYVDNKVLKAPQSYMYVKELKV